MAVHFNIESYLEVYHINLLANNKFDPSKKLSSKLGLIVCQYKPFVSRGYIYIYILLQIPCFLGREQFSQNCNWGRNSLKNKKMCA